MKNKLSAVKLKLVDVDRKCDRILLRSVLLSDYDQISDSYIRLIRSPEKPSPSLSIFINFLGETKIGNSFVGRKRIKFCLKMTLSFRGYISLSKRGI